MNKFKEYIKQDKIQNVLSFSGGKDSTAIYLLALKSGIKFNPVFCDTGNEHELTIDFVKNLHKQCGGPKIKIIKADFSEKMSKRRDFIKEKWEGQIDPLKIERALDLMQPTGNPFLDLSILKGRFPSSQARFCTEELKVLPMMFQIMFPAMKKGPVISWQGVRAQESIRRSKMNKIEWGEAKSIIYRPIFHWKHEDVFNLHAEMGVNPNPLYKMGMTRVGCMPCIMCKKQEILRISQRFPEHIDRISEWEEIVSEASKRGCSTFFASDTATYPEGYDPEEDGYYKIHDIVEWSKTTRGGRQYDLLGNVEQSGCSSIYGLCE